MKVLVTGGTGYIGSHTIVELISHGYEVVAVDDFSNSKPVVLDNLKEITGKEITFYELDVCDKDKLRRVFEENKIDAVIHFAHDLGYEVVEKRLAREAVYGADEAFFTGTAAEITPIASVDGLDVGPGHRGPITEALQQHFFDYVQGKIADKYGWLTPCND